MAINANPETLLSQLRNPVPSMDDDEDSKIRALVETPALDWGHSAAAGRGPMSGRTTGGSWLRPGGFDQRKPPEGYVCHRCKVPGHFIQHCSTNGDPTYDVKRVRRSTGVPRSKLMASSDGSYALPNGAVAVFTPDEAAFEREVEGLPSSSRFSGSNLPPELHCPLCKQVMRYAVFTSKCCFESFCDKCIRDHIIAKRMCVCGARNVLADDLLPNKTLRDTINRMLESHSSSRDSDNRGSQAQVVESCYSQTKAASPKHPLASNGKQMTSLNQKEETLKLIEVEEEVSRAVAVRLPEEVGDDSEANLESVGGASLADQEFQEKPVSGEAVNQDYMMMSMHPGYAAYNQYWAGMQPGKEAFTCPPFSYMPYGGVFPLYPYGRQGYMMHFGPPEKRDRGQPLMKKEEHEARKVNLKRKHEDKRHAEGGRYLHKDNYESSSNGGHFKRRPSRNWKGSRESERVEISLMACQG